MWLGIIVHITTFFLSELLQGNFALTWGNFLLYFVTLVGHDNCRYLLTFSSCSFSQIYHCTDSQWFSWSIVIFSLSLLSLSIFTTGNKKTSQELFLFLITSYWQMLLIKVEGKFLVFTKMNPGGGKDPCSALQLFTVSNTTPLWPHVKLQIRYWINNKIKVCEAVHQSLPGHEWSGLWCCNSFIIWFKYFCFLFPLRLFVCSHDFGCCLSSGGMYTCSSQTLVYLSALGCF